VDPLEYIQIKYEEDPDAFRQGFDNFCGELQRLCLNFSSKNQTETPFTAGFKFASLIAFAQIEAVIQKSAKMAEEEQKKQDELRERLEWLYNK
jgi:hypothetical protein